MPKGRLGTLVASRRKAASMTQEDVVIAAGRRFRREAVAQIERDRTKTLGPEMTNMLAEAIPDLTVEELCRAMGYKVTGDAAPVLNTQLDTEAALELARHPPETQRYIVFDLVPAQMQQARAFGRRLEPV